MRNSYNYEIFTNEHKNDESSIFSLQVALISMTKYLKKL